jgi:cytochrome c-type biogenesis protein CcmH/NrfG
MIDPVLRPATALPPELGQLEKERREETVRPVVPQGAVMTVKTRRQQIEEMLADQPGDPELRYMLAMELVSAGDDAGAVGCFRDLLSVSPDYPPAYHQVGRALQRLGRIDEARGLLQQGIPIALQKGDQHAAGEMQELLDYLE